MNTRRRVLPVLCAGVITVAAAGVPGAAVAAPEPAPPLVGQDIASLPVALANPGVPHAVIEALPEVIQQSDVHIDDSYVPGTPIVHPDGTLVEGQHPDVARAFVESRALCAGAAFAPPTGSFGAASTCGSVVFGSPGYHRPYSWNVGNAGIAAPRACAQGRGFTAQKVRTWGSVGCGTHTGGKVHWGNVLGNPALRATTLSPPMPVSVRWTS